jgi:hypothetical protein
MVQHSGTPAGVLTSVCRHPGVFAKPPTPGYFLRLLRGQELIRQTDKRHAAQYNRDGPR